MIQNKNIVITGANGFLGGALCNLLSQSNRIFAVVSANHKYDVYNKNKNITYIYCDMKDYNKLNLMINEKIDIIFHLAWDGSAGEKRKDINCQMNNIIASNYLYEFAKKTKCNKIVFAASIMEYEINDLMYRDISAPLSSLYSVSKLTVDYFYRILCLGDDICYIRALISNVYGPGEVSSRFINSTIRKMLRREHCSFTTAEQLYDFIYIDDAINLISSLAENGCSNKTYYIGSGQPTKLKDYILCIRDLIDKNIVLGFGEIESSNVLLNYTEFDLKSAFLDTGYNLKFDFTTGIKNTIEYLKEISDGEF